VRGVLGVLVAVGVLTVFVIATDPGSGADRDRRNGPALALEADAAEAVPALALAGGGVPVPPPRLASDDGCDGHETLCAVVATDDPGETLQHLGATWRRGDGQRYRVRVVVAPDAL
jgi:DNA-binding transcriptional LysR family regulator